MGLSKSSDVPSANILRNYLNISLENNKKICQLHYREAGTGTPIVLLHPSPLSSDFMTPVISLFSRHARAIAWDTPGYGQSDALPQNSQGLKPYVEMLHHFITNLQLEQPIVYGSATGAQIAVEYAKAYPRHTRGLLLENIAFFFDEEIDAMMESYFPDISPQSDGSHLQHIWQMANQTYRYFPWYDTSAKALINRQNVPPEIVQKTVLNILLAGDNYDRAYRAAFRNEKPEQLQCLNTPTYIVRWQDSIIKAYADRLDCIKLPDNIVICFAHSGSKARFSVLENTLKKLIANK